MARAQEIGAARPDTDIDDLVRLVNAIGMAIEDALDCDEQAERLSR